MTDQDIAFDDRDSIVSYFKSLLRQDPEINQPVAAIESLIALLSASPPSTTSETLALIESSTSTLKASITPSLALSAGTDLFQRYIVSILQTGSGSDFNTIRKHLLTNSNVFVERAKEARRSIARNGKHLVQDECVILTCGYSRVVSALLYEAANDGKAFKLIYAEASNSPSRSLVSALRNKKVHLQPILRIQSTGLEREIFLESMLTPKLTVESESLGGIAPERDTSRDNTFPWPCDCDIQSHLRDRWCRERLRKRRRDLRSRHTTTRTIDQMLQQRFLCCSRKS